MARRYYNKGRYYRPRKIDLIFCLLVILGFVGTGIIYDLYQDSTNPQIWEEKFEEADNYAIDCVGHYIVPSGGRGIVWGDYPIEKCLDAWDEADKLAKKLGTEPAYTREDIEELRKYDTGDDY